MSWLVTGGAGYIGSHVADALLQDGVDVVVVDDVSTGRRSFVPDGAAFVEGRVEDPVLMNQVFTDHTVEGVIHLAGYKFAGLSVTHPLEAYTRNTVATVVLVDAMVTHGVTTIIFSSSCSVYGDTGSAQVHEGFPLTPASPYGRSKLAAEQIIRNVGASHGLIHTSLRYFNVIGTRLEGVFDLSSQNIVPAVHDALLAGQTPRINGGDYDTPDGTCVRDYIGVGELADAHVAAAQRAMAGQPLAPAYNLGSDSGASVKDIFDTAKDVTGIDFDPVVGPRRPGDPASIIATSRLAAQDLGWAPRQTLDALLRSDWEARRRGISPERP